MAFRYPLNTKEITQGFSNPNVPFAQYGPHNGIDFKANTGTAVYAADEGAVEFEGWGQKHSWMLQPAGICVLINHIGSYAGYAHLSSTVVNKGDKVTKGQLIGYVGSTGAATGPHLHFEMLPLKPNFKNGYGGRIDPTQYMENIETATADEVRKAYLDILERIADQAGINHYTKYPLAFVRDDLAKSSEKRDLDARKAAAAKAEAERKAEEARKAEERRKAEAEALAAQKELERIEAEKKAAEEAANNKNEQYNQLIKENNTLLKQILSIVQSIANLITKVFK